MMSFLVTKQQRLFFVLPELVSVVMYWIYKSIYTKQSKDKTHLQNKGIHVSALGTAL